VHPEILGHDVQQEQEHGSAEHASMTPGREPRPREERAERDAGVHPGATRAHAHRVAGEDQRALGALMADRGERQIDGAPDVRR
jgi:hypothetical protein